MNVAASLRRHFLRGETKSHPCHSKDWLSPEAGEEDRGGNEFPLREQMALLAFKGTSLTLSDSQTENKRIRALSTFRLAQL